MANEIKLITFADSEVTATDDAYVYETATGEGGVINGCAVTIKNASELHITGGNGILCGRKFTIFDSDIPVTLSSSGTLLGRLYIHMDLSNASTPIQLMIETGASLTPVQQDADVNATNGVYEINLSTFNVDTSTISDLVDVSPKVYPHEVLNTVDECVASTNPGDIAGASAVSELNSKSLKQLWVNTSPSSNFSAQTIALSSSDYDYLILISKNAAASSGAMSIMALKGMGFYTEWCNRDGNYPMLAYRFIQYVDDTHFSAPTATTTSHVSGLGSNDSYLVPIAIYGGKF